MPEQYEQCRVEALVSCVCDGTFQTVPLQAKLDVTEFGKYLKIILIDDTEKVTKQPVMNAFQFLMSERSTKVWPAFRNLDRPNKRFQLHNAIVRWLQDHNLGWQKEYRSLGEHFVHVLGECLWLVDPHRQNY